MGAQKIGLKGIRGEFFLKLNTTVNPWVDRLSMKIDSDSAQERYEWLGQTAGFREWTSERFVKDFGENGYIIVNKEFEATIPILVSELRRDKNGFLLIRIRDLARRTDDHWAQLLTAQIIAGEVDLCYDGVSFFNASHTENGSALQSNISNQTAVSPSAPTADEFSDAVLDVVSKIVAINDDLGQPLNADAKTFTVMVPTTYLAAAHAGLGNPVLDNGKTNTAVNIPGFTFNIEVNPRLTWTTKFGVFREDTESKPLISQSEVEVELDVLDQTFAKKRWLHGATATRNSGFGFWQYAHLATFTT